MTRKIIKQFASQFGKDWQCSCKAAFKVSSLDIVSETENSLVAHYVCPECGKEQMLAASISNDQNLSEEIPFSFSGSITADDVLDIRDEFRHMKPAALRTLQRSGSTRQRQKQTSPKS